MWPNGNMLADIDLNAMCMTVSASLAAPRFCFGFVPGRSFASLLASFPNVRLLLFSLRSWTFVCFSFGFVPERSFASFGFVWLRLATFRKEMLRLASFGFVWQEAKREANERPGTKRKEKQTNVRERSQKRSKRTPGNEAKREARSCKTCSNGHTHSIQIYVS